MIRDERKREMQKEKDRSVDCPHCGGKADFFFKTKDYNRRISNEIFSYWRCSICELVFLSDIPDNLLDYYREGEDSLPTVERLKKIARREEYKVEMIKKIVTKGRLLEVGPSRGAFAYQAKQAGFEVDTIEMDRRCCEYLRETVGVRAVQSEKPQETIKGMAGHDVIALWQVIEHLPDPWACLKSAAENLTPGGILLIATPNYRSLQFGLMGPSWPHVDAPRHLFLIPANLLVQYLKALCLEPVLLTFNDEGAVGWNRFGWQRYLMNRFSNKSAQIAAFVLGYLVGFSMKTWEQKGTNGCSYTIVFRKKTVPSS